MSKNYSLILSVLAATLFCSVTTTSFVSAEPAKNSDEAVKDVSDKDVTEAEPATEITDAYEEEHRQPIPPPAYATGELAKLHPEQYDPEPHLRAATSLIQEKQYKEAQKELDIALDLNPNYYEAWAQQALLYYLTGHDDQAIAKYIELTSVKPDLVDARVNLGSLLAKKDRLKDAEWELRKATAINFRSVQGHYNLANVLVRQGRLEEALIEYKMCLKLSPNNAMAYNNMGVIYQCRNYLEEAHEAFLHALALDPANAMFDKNLTLLRQQLHAKTYEARRSNGSGKAISSVKSVTR